nr:integrase, catalytic region, zinc finger, CCHC-type, peptidase aspartic, catalytic [Tanacetum cinerariifolium]
MQLKLAESSSEHGKDHIPRVAGLSWGRWGIMGMSGGLWWSGAGVGEMVVHAMAGKKGMYSDYLNVGGRKTSNHKVAKDLWERIQLLMQGTSLTKQERECKIYDEFDNFAYKKGESLREFYLRFSLLLNDKNIYNMKLEQFQVNTKFLNTLPPE